jgi:hypothetical protein
MKSKRSKLCKNLACALMLSGLFLTSCQDSAQNSDAAKADSAVAQGADTSHNGLEGTQDQSASLSTDVKADTSAGQSANKNGNVDSNKSKR